MSDLISREQAIEVVVDELDRIDHVPQWVFDALSLRIKALPSAELQIIRCKDCKWWDKKEGSRFGYCHAIKHGYYTSHWEISIHRKYEENFYCADAERRGYEAD